MPHRAISRDGGVGRRRRRAAIILGYFAASASRRATLGRSDDGAVCAQFPDAAEVKKRFTTLWGARG
jgi:hypothetical protein